MKLVKQTLLHFQAGSSDKVYEVDLCEVGADHYVVNFRYGRRGTNLKEGIKTTRPVSRVEADKVFTALVTEKMRKGYRNVTAQAGAPASSPNPRPALTNDAEARKSAVLARLNAAAQNMRKGQQEQTWKLERVIWRAGELKLQEAASALTKLLGGGNSLRTYCSAWALGWCGDAQTLPVLQQLAANASQPEHVRRIAGEAARKLADDESRAPFIQQLPPSLRELARTGPSEQFAEALRAHLNTTNHEHFSTLYTLYLIDNEIVRPVLLELLRTAPLAPNYFQQIRHIFKAAEYRRDAEVFGLLAYRFEKERSNYARWYDSRRNDPQVVGRTVYAPKSAIKKPDAQFAYGEQTRRYLRRRVWRTLRRLGELNDPDYVKLAVGVLLPFTDADAHEPKTSNFYEYEQRSWRRVLRNTVRWDAFAPYFAFNHILYINSSRYELKPSTFAWRCRGNYKPGAAEPAAREEAFPKLWEAQPVGLLHLLAESDCLPVHQFAAKALRACADFCAQLDVKAVAMLLARPYEATAQLGFELAQKLYRAEAPDFALVLAVADCPLAAARAEAQRWISAARERFLADSVFIANLAASRQADTREFARNLLLAASLSEQQAQAVSARLLAQLLTLAEAQAELAADIKQTLLRCFAAPLRRISLQVVNDLLRQPLLAAQELGGELLLNHETPAAQLPAELIESLIASPHSSMRGIGVRLLGQLPDERLRNQEGLILALALHELADVRDAARPLIQRLSNADAAFNAQLAELFVIHLLRREPHEGLHKHLSNLLQTALAPEWLDALEKDTTLRLLHSRSTGAQDLGAFVLARKLERAAAQAWAESFATKELARCGNHEVRAVRDAAQAVFTRVINRFQHATNPYAAEEMAQAVRLLDAKWDDVRAFYFNAFEQHFTAEELTPTILVSICDSVRPDVQGFGRRLLTHYFAEADGPEYLLKLSEHPTAEMQTFATNYLERYAAGNVERLRALTPYFIGVLSRVNRARTAKDRVLAFLAAEAQRSAAAAALVAEILTRQSVTMAIGDKAASLEAMLAIRRAYPAIALPIKVKPVEARHAI